MIYPVVYHSSSPISKAKGVSILIARSVPWSPGIHIADQQGRFLIVKGAIGATRVTLVNVYFPNSNQLPFLRALIPLILEHSDGLLIVGEDFNFACDPLLDVSKGVSHLSFSYLKQLKAELNLLQLVDVWRLHHPNVTDYTFFSPVHSTYSKINYFFITQKDLDRVRVTSTEPILLADHGPV